MFHLSTILRLLVECERKKSYNIKVIFFANVSFQRALLKRFDAQKQIICGMFSFTLLQRDIHLHFMQQRKTERKRWTGQVLKTNELDETRCNITSIGKTWQIIIWLLHTHRKFPDVQISLFLSCLFLSARIINDVQINSSIERNFFRGLIKPYRKKCEIVLRYLKLSL